MGQYVTLNIRTEVFDEIINDLMTYSTSLNEYYELASTIHLIDYLQEEYDHDTTKRNQEFKQWLKYEELFLERYKDENFLTSDGKVNENGKYEYMNFNKVNKIIEDYKEGGSLDILDSKQQFFLVLDIINAFEGSD